MPNRIDFFTSETTGLAVPAGAAVVFVDGILCPWLVVKEIVRSGWPEFCWSRLAYNAPAESDSVSIDAGEVESRLGFGRSVRIEQIYNGLIGQASAEGLVIFDGQIERIETELSGSKSSIEVIARDMSAELRRIIIYGRYVAEPDESVLLLGACDTIFNDDAKANACSVPVQYEDKNLTLFAGEPTETKLWSCAEAMQYLLSLYAPAGRLQIPALEQLQALTDGQILPGLNVTGMNLLESLQSCCERTGLQFRFVPRATGSGPSQAIVFYRTGTGRTVELNCQHHGEKLSISRSNIAKLQGVRNFWPVTHRHIGYGDSKTFESTFDLVKAWDPADEDDDYDKFSGLTNPEFYKVRDVYRKWCLNEAGDYTGSPYNQGEAFDFSKIFENNNFIRRCRRFIPSLSTDKQGKSFGYFLEVSFDDGAYWWQYVFAFENLLDECGIRLTSAQLDPDTWVAAITGVLKFRITASVVSDERLCRELADGSLYGTAPVIERVFAQPGSFAYRKVSAKSIFANRSDGSVGVADEADDGAALSEFLRKKAQTACDMIETVDLQTPLLALDYEVGDIVMLGPDSRNLDSIRPDIRSIITVEHVRMDFANQCTNLRLVRRSKPQL